MTAAGGAAGASPDAGIREWACLDRDERGDVVSGIEVHLTEDEWSPSGWGWWYTIYRARSGGLEEYDGGILWDYKDYARKMAPFRVAYESRRGFQP